MAANNNVAKKAYRKSKISRKHENIKEKKAKKWHQAYVYQQHQKRRKTKRNNAIKVSSETASAKKSNRPGRKRRSNNENQEIMKAAAYQKGVIRNKHQQHRETISGVAWRNSISNNKPSASMPYMKASTAKESGVINGSISISGGKQYQYQR